MVRKRPTFRKQTAPIALLRNDGRYKTARHRQAKAGSEASANGPHGKPELTHKEKVLRTSVLSEASDPAEDEKTKGWLNSGLQPPCDREHF